MKKYLIIVALAAASLYGCTKTMDAVPEREIINPNPPQPQSIKFQATIDGPYVVGKVAVPTDDFYTVWEQNDEILVFEGTKKATYTANVGKDVWTILEHSEGDVIADESKDHVAYYPASFYTDGLPSVISYEQACAETLVGLPMVAQAEAGSNTLAFKYMCGIAKFVYTNSSDQPMVVRTIDLKAKNPLSGKGTINLGPIPSFELDGDAGVTIDFGKEGKTLNPGEPLDIYIPLPGSVYKKLTATINTVDEKQVVLNYSGKAMINRAGLTTLNLNFVPGPDDPIDGEDLSKDGTANCYVVEKSASYKFPAVKGNSPATETIPGIASVELLWETFNDYTAPDPEDFITFLDYTRGWVVFDLGAGCYGNAAIAAKDADGKILWTWHIWIVKSSIGTETWGGRTVMDRHLGAPEKTTGTAKDNQTKWTYSALTYQWGRKDPFPGGSDVESSIPVTVYDIDNKVKFLEPELRPVYDDHSTTNLQLAIEHPDVFYYATSSSWPSVDWLTDEAALQNNDLWGGKTNAKTIYDPCPEGWWMPAAGDGWGFRSEYKKGGKLTDDTSYDESYPWYQDSDKSIGFRYKTTDGKIFWFPLVGNIDCTKGTLQSVGGSGMYNTRSDNSNTVFYESMAWGNPASEAGLNRPYGAATRCIKE